MANPGATAARRYAEAAFQLAMRDKQLDAFGDGLDAAASMLGSGAVLDVLRSPARPTKERLDVVDKVLAKRVPEPVRKLVGLLVERGKIDRLPAVAAEYRRLLNIERGVVQAVAKSAAPLNKAETDALARKVTEMTGRKVDLTVE